MGAHWATPTALKGKGAVRVCHADGPLGNEGSRAAISRWMKIPLKLTRRRRGLPDVGPLNLALSFCIHPTSAERRAANEFLRSGAHLSLLLPCALCGLCACLCCNSVSECGVARGVRRKSLAARNRTMWLRIQHICLFARGSRRKGGIRCAYVLSHLSSSACRREARRRPRVGG